MKQRINWKKLVGVNCLHCKEMLGMIKKWMMMDEIQNWTCNNCGSEYRAKGLMINDILTIEIIERTRKGEFKTILLKFNDDNQTFSAEV